MTYNHSIVITNALDEKEALKKDFNLYFFALGYEKRCTYIFEKTKATVENSIVFKLENTKHKQYETNAKVYHDKSFCPVEVKLGDIFALLKKRIQSINESTVSILFDISSLPRTYIATVLYVLNQISEDGISINITVAYATAKYAKAESEGPITTAGPVIPELAGWPEHPNMPTCCVVGLGYENGKALGAIEYIEPNRSWLLRPIGREKKYISDVDKANEDLKDITSMVALDYDLTKPYRTFKEVDSLVSSLLESYRIVIVPFGPKLFFAISSILTLKHYPSISLWRISSDHLGEKNNSEASGELSFVEVNFLPRGTQDK
jgi:hypothetical protein